MKIVSVLVPHDIEEKLETKHHVTREEVEQIFQSNPHFRFSSKGHVHGEDLYRAIGRTDGGRYLVVFFIYKANLSALVISARDLTSKERRQYGRK